MNAQELLDRPIYKLKYMETTSTPCSFSSIEEIAASVENGYIILWQYHDVFTGIIEAKQSRWLNQEKPEQALEHIVRLRAFSTTKEYHFWRSRTGLQGRLREDVAGTTAPTKKMPVINASMIIRGVIAEPLMMLNRFNVMEKISLKTRNYIEFNPIGQAGYVDSRFVDFEEKK